MAKQERYSKDFKLQAAKLVVEQGYSFREAGERLGVSAWSIRYWVGRFRETGELPPEGKSRPSTEELQQLRKENLRLHMENDILKKAAAYFAKECM